MRKVLIAACSLVALAACSAQQPAHEDAGPDISPSAAPGVKFSYRYAFLLPDDSIADVQEQHAQACERLGPTKCRITGMRYTLVANDEVRAMLALRLDPAIARQFGKAGIETVKKASGSLVDSEIDGTLDTAPAAAPAKAGEEALAPAPLPSAVAAMTPMVFDYNGGIAMTGLGGGRIASAFATATASFVMMASVIVIAIGGGAPWALALIGGLLAWRSGWARRLRARLTRDPAAV